MNTARQMPSRRSSYPLFRTVATRWSDNDVYGHMNNTVHYSLFDTVVNAYLMERGILDPHRSKQVFLVVETGCRYFAELAFPDLIAAGIRIGHLGSSSVRYEIGLFRNDEEVASADGHFVHVNVDKTSRRPMSISPTKRAALEAIMKAS